MRSLRSVVKVTPAFPPQVLAALGLLLRAWEYAADCRRDPWDFAVDIRELRALGLTTTDLRYLLHKGYAHHALEKTKLRGERRAFGRLNGPVIAENASGDNFAPLSGQSADVLEVLGRDFRTCHQLSYLRVTENGENPLSFLLYGKGICAAKQVLTSPGRGTDGIGRILCQDVVLPWYTQDTHSPQGNRMSPDSPARCRRLLLEERLVHERRLTVRRCSE